MARGNPIAFGPLYSMESRPRAPRSQRWRRGGRGWLARETVSVLGL